MNGDPARVFDPRWRCTEKRRQNLHAHNPKTNHTATPPFEVVKMVQKAIFKQGKKPKSGKGNSKGLEAKNRRASKTTKVGKRIVKPKNVRHL